MVLYRNAYFNAEVAPSRYDKAEKFATEALDMHLFTSSLSAAKAHFRRSSARLRLANFLGALEGQLVVLGELLFTEPFFRKFTRRQSCPRFKSR